MANLDRYGTAGPEAGQCPGQYPSFDMESGPFVNRVILFSSEYDKHRMEQDCSIASSINMRYSLAEINLVPRVDHITTEELLFELMGGSCVDLLILFNVPTSAAAKLIERTNATSPSTMIALVSEGMEGSDRGTTGPDVFVTSSWGKVVPSIIQIYEDRAFLARMPGARSLVVPVMIDAPRARTRLCGIIADQIWADVSKVAMERATLSERIQVISRRPRVHIQVTGSEIHFPPERIALTVYEGRFAQDGPKIIHSGQSDDDIGKAISVALGFQAIEVGDSEPVHDLRSLERFVSGLNEEMDTSSIYRVTLRPWVRARTEFELMDTLDRIVEAGGPDLPMALSRAINSFRTRPSRGHTDFEGKTEEFSRIGGGHMGGKGRGLSFLRTVIQGSDLSGSLNIELPRTVIIGTDVFDQFLELNHIDPKGLEVMSDERIVDLFLKSDLPSTVIGHIRRFTGSTHDPIVVRSSSMLEDALYQPFAGIYASVMLSNSSLELDKRFKHLTMAIKYVYASTYFKKARAYLASTGSGNVGEKMAIVVQGVVGQWHRDLYYPTFSGVARSFNYWPFGCCRSDDGIVNLALGLGKTIVDGGASVRFCPLHPQASYHASASDKIDQSQKRFYALRIGSTLKSNEFTEDVQIVHEDLSRAVEDGVTGLLTSTFSPDDDRFTPGGDRDGLKVVDFSPILQLGVLPLPETIKRLLDMLRFGMGSHIEIEFAVNIDPKTERATIYLLQVRSMRTREQFACETCPTDDPSIIMKCSRTMGNGSYIVKDIVMVRGNTLESSEMPLIVKEVSRFNAELGSESRPYMLIGPGRWGSCDPWLGIPVSWNDISSAKVIVERPVGDRSIDPSQGSHFFHNIASLNLGYLTLSPDEDSCAQWGIMDNGEAQHGKVVHIRIPAGIEVLIAGDDGHGLVRTRDRVEGTCNG